MNDWPRIRPVRHSHGRSSDSFFFLRVLKYRMPIEATYWLRVSARPPRLNRAPLRRGTRSGIKNPLPRSVKIFSYLRRLVADRALVSDPSSNTWHRMRSFLAFVEIFPSRDRLSLSSFVTCWMVVGWTDAFSLWLLGRWTPDAEEVGMGWPPAGTKACLASWRVWYK